MNDIQLFLADGSKGELLSKNQILERIDRLDFKAEKELMFSRKGRRSAIKIVCDLHNRIHIYRPHLNKLKQTFQPISKAVCRGKMEKYLSGESRWYKGIKFIDADPFYVEMEPEFEKKPSTNDEFIRQRVIIAVFGVGALVISIFSTIYMFLKWDDMHSMNMKVYALLMGGAIGGLVYFIISVFDFLEHLNTKNPDRVV